MIWVRSPMPAPKQHIVFFAKYNKKFVRMENKIMANDINRMRQLAGISENSEMDHPAVKAAMTHFGSDAVGDYMKYALNSGNPADAFTSSEMDEYCKKMNCADYEDFEERMEEADNKGLTQFEEMDRVLGRACVASQIETFFNKSGYSPF